MRSLLAVQAENPSQSAWAVATRTRDPRQADLAGLLASGRVLRTHVLRPTWHYVHADDALWLIELTRSRVLPTVDQQLAPLADRMAALADAVVEILAESPDRTRAELADSLAQRGHELTGMQLMLLAAHLELHALICSGVPRGGEHTYALFADRVACTAPAGARRGARRSSPCATSPLTGPPRRATSPTGRPSPSPTCAADLAGAADRLESFEHDDRTYWHAPGEAPVVRVAERPPAAGAGRDVPRLSGLALGSGCRRPALAGPRDGDRHGPRRRPGGRRHEARGCRANRHVRAPTAAAARARRERRRSRMPRPATPPISGSNCAWCGLTQPVESGIDRISRHALRVAARARTRAARTKECRDRRPLPGETPAEEGIPLRPLDRRVCSGEYCGACAGRLPPSDH